MVYHAGIKQSSRGKPASAIQNRLRIKLPAGNAFRLRWRCRRIRAKQIRKPVLQGITAAIVQLHLQIDLCRLDRMRELFAQAKMIGQHLRNGPDQLGGRHFLRKPLIGSSPVSCMLRTASSMTAEQSAGSAARPASNSWPAQVERGQIIEGERLLIQGGHLNFLEVDVQALVEKTLNGFF